ncbi:Sec31p SCDLUD_000274 [Saccharomycodes ludwigii]|uniref:Sec31p n=1 Tax=Saccharomycodes ludwigii TaxID=36035 RepID=UPI001E8C4EDE|nr:hypothetical protein SCDLUD_000274 [Saccharomycodes ludwigii]KAH3902690.1 hypothetical protein SCDLUD_000274 [Saccharomycodes ludwigii]
MVKIAEYQRTATFTWSHDKIPILATGTASGTVDANFSSDSVLEFWSLLSIEKDKPINKIKASAKFNDLDWGFDPNKQLVAGALDNGTVEFYDPSNDNIISSNSTAHSTPVRTLTFNSKQNNILLSGGSKGEIFIWDVNKINDASYTPSGPGTAMTPLEEINSLAWNQNLAHVFSCAGTSSTYASIWDLKAKKEVIHLSYTSPATGVKAQLSVVEWHPTSSTKIATATGSDIDPAILIWDLRNSNTPLTVLKNNNGHSKGILSLDWCKQDSHLFLSSGRDNTCILWDPESNNGELLTKYPTRGNWCFKTKFAYETPDIFASASFDNKVQVLTLQDLTTKFDIENTNAEKDKTEADFWNTVSSSDANFTSGHEKPTVVNLYAPAWYGNKSPAAQWAFGGKLVYIKNDGDEHSVEITKPDIPGIFSKNTMLDNALKTKDFNPIINKRLAQAIDSTNEEDWNLLEKLALDGKDVLLKESLSFEDDVADEEQNDKDSSKNGEDFFENLEFEKYVPNKEEMFKLDTSSPLSKYLCKGDMKSALNFTLSDDKFLLETLIIALESDDELLKSKAKNAYFSKYISQTPGISRLLYSVSNKSCEDLVQSVDVSQWKYAAMAVLNYNKENKDELLVDLGNRVLQSGNRQDAIILYLAGNSLDKVASVWLDEFNKLEQEIKSKKSTAYEAHLECLTEFVERFTCFSNYATGSGVTLDNDLLIAKFLEFVNLVAGNGDFELALEFLTALPGSNKDVDTEKQRVLIASGKSSSGSSNAAGKKQHSSGVATTSNNKYANNIINSGATHGLPIQPHFTQRQQQQQQQQQLRQTSVYGVPSYGNNILDNHVPLPGKNSTYVPSASDNIVTPPTNSIPMAPLPARKYTPAVTGVTSAAISTPLNPYAKPLVSPAVPSNPYAPQVASTVATPISVNATTDSNSLPSNPYAPKSNGAAPTSAASTSYFYKPPTANVIANNGSSNLNGFNNDVSGSFAASYSPSLSQPLPLSSQDPRINKKANEGWNDLALPVKDKQVRAKAVSTQPSTPIVNMPTTANVIPPPPLSRISSNVNNLNNFGGAAARPGRSGSVVSNISNSAINKYAPSISQQQLAPVSTTPTNISPPANPYAPPTNISPPGNPYAPPTGNNRGGSMTTPLNPYTPPTQQPVINGIGQPSTNSVGPNITTNIIPPPPKSMKRKPHIGKDSAAAIEQLSAIQQVPSETRNEPIPGPQPVVPASFIKEEDTNSAIGMASTTKPVMPEEFKTIIEFFQAELERVAPLVPQEFNKQLKDSNKRLKILFGHLEKQDLLTQTTIEKLLEIVKLMKNKDYAGAKAIQVEIATEFSAEAGNWLTGIKRLIGIAEATADA